MKIFNQFLMQYLQA